jgi:hypothetical protein
MENKTLRRMAMVVAAATFAAACGKSPGGPSDDGGGGGGGGAATITSVTIGGATSVAVGGTAQLTATANKSDGTTEDVTNTATWRSTDATVLSVSGTGLVTALKAGSADVTATVGSREGRRTVQVSVARFQVTVALQGVTALSTCDDVTQGLTNGEFAVRALAVAPGGATQTLVSTTGYPGNPDGLLVYNLSEGETQSLSGTASFTLTGEAGQFVRTDFRATEWDQQIVVIPPSIRWIHDDRMSDTSASRTHSYANGTFGSLGPNSLTIGNSSCGIRLNYSVSVAPQ